MLPDCDTIANGPGLMWSISSTALTDSANDGRMLRIPMQLGPSTRTPPARAIFMTCSCMRRPSSPVSAKPSL